MTTLECTVGGTRLESRCFGSVCVGRVTAMGGCRCTMRTKFRVIEAVSIQNLIIQDRRPLICSGAEDLVFCKASSTVDLAFFFIFLFFFFLVRSRIHRGSLS